MKSLWSVVVCLAAAQSGAAADQNEKRNVPSYTNEDLARVSPRRGETGVESEPVAAAGRGGERERAEPKGRGEQFWRREAERQQRRLEPLQRQLADLEQKLAARRQKRGVKPYSDPQVEGYVARIEALRRRIRDEEDRFLDRARREGVLPGWLR